MSFFKSKNRSKTKKTNHRKRAASSEQLSFGRLEPRQLLAADVLITEFLASNGSGLVDGNGNESDWIELYNAGDQAQDLAGWHLTDNGSDLSKWVFPNVAESVLAPGEYLVVFASGDGVAVNWVADTPTPGFFENQFLVGDINQDGIVDFADLSPFITRLQVGTFLAEADIDGNGSVDFADISPFIALLSSQG